MSAAALTVSVPSPKTGRSLCSLSDRRPGDDCGGPTTVRGGMIKARISTKSKFFKSVIPVVASVAFAMSGRLTAQEQQPQNANPPVYKLVFLDTLGGPTSGISCCGILPSVLNNQSTAVGVADTQNSNPNFAIENPTFVPDPFINIAVYWHSNVPTKLPALSGGYNSFANAISNTGFIAGESETGEIDPN